MNLTVSHRGQTYTLSLLPDDTLAALQAKLEELTLTPPLLQKLLYKGKTNKNLDDQITLTQAGLKDGMKIQMLGTTSKELDGMKAVENEQHKRDRIMRERALKGPTKVCKLYITNGLSRFDEPYVSSSDPQAALTVAPSTIDFMNLYRYHISRNLHQPSNSYSASPKTLRSSMSCRNMNSLWVS